jgi:hypothetical protein
VARDYAENILKLVLFCFDFVGFDVRLRSVGFGVGTFVALITFAGTDVG